MSQERVKSKNLFNFRPQGFIDPVVVAEDEKMKQDFGLDPVAMAEHMVEYGNAFGGLVFGTFAGTKIIY